MLKRLARLMIVLAILAMLVGSCFVWDPVQVFGLLCGLVIGAIVRWFICVFICVMVVFAMHIIVGLGFHLVAWILDREDLHDRASRIIPQ